MPLVKLCTACGWHYLLRICAEHTCRRFFNGKLEHSWKRLSTIVRHRVAIIGMAEPGSGKRRRSKRTSVWCGTTSMRNRGYSSVIREQDTDRSRLMPGACAWKRRFKIAKVVAGTSKPVGLKIEHTRDSLAAGALSGYVVDLASGRSLYPSRTTAARMTRVDRRDKSIFRLGRLWLLDILRRVHNRASLRHCLPFQKTNMGWRFALRF